MEITTKELKRVILVAPVGRIDHQSAPELQKTLESLIDQGQFKLVLDMSGVNYISSAGLRVLLATRKVVKRWNRGDIRLAHIQPYVRETLELVGFTRIFQLYDDVVEAVGSF